MSLRPGAPTVLPAGSVPPSDFSPLSGPGHLVNCLPVTVDTVCHVYCVRVWCALHHMLSVGESLAVQESVLFSISAKSKVLPVQTPVMIYETLAENSRRLAGTWLRLPARARWWVRYSRSGPVPSGRPSFALPCQQGRALT